MSANTETTGADRTGCKAWCGRTDQRPANGDYTDGPFQPDFRYWDIADGQVPSELVGKPMWCSSACRDARLPPIAAPAAHVERRAGQRWKFRNQHAAHFDATIVERKGLGWKVTDVVDHDGGGKSRAFSDVFWEEPNYYTMTLLADAPPEPARCWCGSPLTGETLCSTHAAEAAKFKSPPAQEAPMWWQANARCGFPIVSSNREAAVTAVGKHQATCEKCSAQEAPKAAPVCENPHGDNGSDIDTVVVDGRAHRWCVPCWSAHVVWTAEQTGKPYAGPERLPRPRLAADWVEDCLPESGR